MRYCGQCGQPLDEGVAFCTECGAPVAPVLKRTAAAAEPAEPAKPAGKKKKNGGTVALIIAIIVAALLLAAVAGVVVVRWLQNRNAGEAVHDDEGTSEEAGETGAEAEAPESDAKQALYDTVSVTGLTVSENEYGSSVAVCTLTAPDLEAGFDAALESIGYDENDPEASEDALYAALAAIGETVTVDYTADVTMLLADAPELTDEELSAALAEQYVDAQLSELAMRLVYSSELVTEANTAVNTAKEAAE